ncbi:hypothetical protein TNCV_3623711 [Trichonephila clavipes]|nr:hypothetical protein TNCV_3623711 [Trichonephila clavipes]
MALSDSLPQINLGVQGIGRKIGERREVTTDSRTITDRGGSSIDLRVKVLRIIGHSMVNAEVVDLIIDSKIKAVDRVVRGTVLSGVRMIKIDIYTFKRSMRVWGPLGHGSGEICDIRGGLSQMFFVSTRQKTKDRVVTAQRAPCCHLGRVESQIRIREFQKTWEFHILNNMQYQCILGIDFMKETKLTLDFDQKSLIIPDDQIKQLPKVGTRSRLNYRIQSSVKGKSKN